jgi:hypothetical protein
MGDTASGSWTSRDLGRHIAEEKARKTIQERYRELAYEELLRDFMVFASHLGGWDTEAGVYLDGKLWALAAKIADGAFQLADKTALLSLRK